MPSQENSDPMMQQAQKILDLGILKAALSNGFRLIDIQYRSIIEKILSPAELLTEEECQIVTGKEFNKALASFAQASSKMAQWHRENNREDVIAFLLPGQTLEQVRSVTLVGAEQEDQLLTDFN